MPIHEPGLEEIIQRNVEEGRLVFSSDPAASVAFADVQFVAVGTPPGEDRGADLRYVLAAARAIGRHMDGFKVIVDKSTVPVGTAEKVAEVVREELAARGREDIEFSVASNPEFLKEGAAIEDFMRPDRIVLGVDDDARGERALALLRELYRPFNRNHERTRVMDRSIIAALLRAGAKVRAHDPVAQEQAARCLAVDLEDRPRSCCATSPSWASRWTRRCTPTR